MTGWDGRNLQAARETTQETRGAEEERGDSEDGETHRNKEVVRERGSWRGQASCERKQGNALLHTQRRVREREMTEKERGGEARKVGIHNTAWKDKETEGGREVGGVAEGPAFAFSQIRKFGQSAFQDSHLPRAGASGS